MENPPAKTKIHCIQHISLKKINRENPIENTENAILSNQNSNELHFNTKPRNQNSYQTNDSETAMTFGNSIEHNRHDPIIDEGPNAHIGNDTEDTLNLKHPNIIPDRTPNPNNDNGPKKAAEKEKYDTQTHQIHRTEPENCLNNLTQNNQDSKPLKTHDPITKTIVPLKQLFNQYFLEVFSTDPMLYQIFYHREPIKPEIFPEHIPLGKNNISIYIKWFKDPHPYILRVIQKILQHLPDYQIQWIKNIDEIPNPELISKKILEKINSSIQKIIQNPHIHTIIWNLKDTNELFEETTQTKNEPHHQGTTNNIISSITCKFSGTIPLLHSILHNPKVAPPDANLLDLKEHSKYTLESIETFQKNPQLVFQKLWNYIMLNNEQINSATPSIPPNSEIEIRAKQSELQFSQPINQTLITLVFQIRFPLQKYQTLPERFLETHLYHTLLQTQDQAEEKIKFLMQTIKMTKSQIELPEQKS